MYGGRTEFKTTRWRTFWSLALFLCVTLITVLYNRTYEFNWVSLFFIGFSFLGFLAYLEAITSYIRLDESEITFRGTFRKTSINRNNIEKASWEKGSGVSIRLKNGKWVKIPDMGHDSQGLSNSLRSWIKDDKHSQTDDE